MHSTEEQKMNQHRNLAVKKRLLVLLCSILISIPLAVNAANLSFSKNVKENKPRNLIQNVQRMLIEIGYDPGIPDGYSGLRTEAAIRSFQRDANLETDGKIGKKTLKALKKAYVSDN